MRKVATAAAIMTILWTATAGVAQAATAPAATARPATGQAAARQWRVAYRTYSATAGPLSSVAAPARDDAWAVGTSGTGSAAGPLILHWTGASWRPAAIPGTAAFAPRLVTAPSPDDVWVLGVQANRSVAWTYDGVTWRRIVLPGPFQDGAFGAVSGSDAWGSSYAVCVTVGIGSAPGSTSCTSTVSHWDGTRWLSLGLDGIMEAITVAGGHAWFLDLTSVQGVTTDHPTGLPVIYETTGSTLTKISVAATRVAAGATVAASPGGQVWVLGRQDTAKGPAVLLHWTGKRWTRIAVPARAGGGPLVVQDWIAYDGGSGVWAGPFAHWTGRRWDNTNPGDQLAGASAYSLAAIAPIPGTSSLWAVGWVARTPADKTHDTLIARYTAAG